MLSRASLLSARQARALVAHVAKSSSAVTTPGASTPAPTTDQPLFRRPVRQEPGKVRLGFVPEEWFQFFYKKTGVTGPYTFGVTLATYLVSKEIYVLEHEFYNGLSLAVVWIAGIKLLGPKLAAYLDKEIDDYEAAWNETRNATKEQLKSGIADEEKQQWSMEGQNLLVAAKRENVALQLEAAYRSRLVEVYSAVKQRLDYQVEKQNIERRISQKNLVDWVVRKVKTSITPDQEKQNIDSCIVALAALSQKA